MAFGGPEAPGSLNGSFASSGLHGAAAQPVESLHTLGDTALRSSGSAAHGSSTAGCSSRRLAHSTAAEREVAQMFQNALSAANDDREAPCQSATSSGGCSGGGQGATCGGGGCSSSQPPSHSHSVPQSAARSNLNVNPSPNIDASLHDGLHGGYSDAPSGPVSQAGRLLITASDVYATVSSSTGIPVPQMTRTQLADISNVQRQIGDAVVGQGAAVAAVSAAVRLAMLGLLQGDRPKCSFLLAGPEGVGKSTLCKVSWW